MRRQRAESADVKLRHGLGQVGADWWNSHVSGVMIKNQFYRPLSPFIALPFLLSPFLFSTPSPPCLVIVLVIPSQIQILILVLASAVESIKKLALPREGDESKLCLLD